MSFDDHRPMPPQPSGFPSTITVNVVVSGHVVLEFLSTASGATQAQIDALAARIKASNEKLAIELDHNLPAAP